jgi:hypothetical protein
MRARIGQALGFGVAARHQHQRRRAVGNRRGIGRRHRAALAEGGLEVRDLVGARRAGLLVGLDDGLALAGFQRDRRDLGGEGAGFLRRPRPLSEPARNRPAPRG